MIGLAMSIGIAKPMPVESRAIAVLMPITAPAASSSGPPLLPGLIAASVWIRLWRLGRRRSGSCGPSAETMPLVTRVGERAERAADRDDQLADLERVRVADRGGRQAGRVDLDDREVGQRVDAVDRAGYVASRP